MAIPFGCDCGKRLQAKDEFAGRKMKCPGCGRVLLIPKAPTRQMALPSTPTPTPKQKPAGRPAVDETQIPGLRRNSRSQSQQGEQTMAAVIRFACSCGRKLKAHLGDAGSPIDCPACGKELTIPYEDTDMPALPPMKPLPVSTPATTRQPQAPLTSRQVAGPATSPAMPLPDRKPAMLVDTLTVQYATPWSSAEDRRQNSKPLREPPVRSRWKVPFGLLVVAAIVAAAWVVVPHGEASRPTTLATDTDLEWIPDGAFGIVCIRPADLVSDKPKQPADPVLELAREIASLREVDKPKKAPDDVPRGPVFSHADMERITLVVLPPTAPVPKGGAKGKGKGEPPPPPPAFAPARNRLVIFRTVQPWKQTDLFWLVLGTNKPAQALLFGKRVYYHANDNSWAIHPIDSKTLLVAMPAVMNQLDTLLVHSKAPSPFPQALSECRGKHAMVLGLNQPAIDKIKQPGVTIQMWLDKGPAGDATAAKLMADLSFQKSDEADRVSKQLETSPLLTGWAQKDIKLAGSRLTLDLTGPPDAGGVPPAPWLPVARALADPQHNWPLP